MTGHGIKPIQALFTPTLISILRFLAHISSRGLWSSSGEHSKKLWALSCLIINNQVWVMVCMYRPWRGQIYGCLILLAIEVMVQADWPAKIDSDQTGLPECLREYHWLRAKARTTDHRPQGRICRRREKQNCTTQKSPAKIRVVYDAMKDTLYVVRFILLGRRIWDEVPT